MGSVTIVVHHDLYQEIDQLELVVERATEFGDGTWILYVHSTQLADGYHGCREFVVQRCTQGKLSGYRFKRDTEV